MIAIVISGRIYISLYYIVCAITTNTIAISDTFAIFCHVAISGGIYISLYYIVYTI